MPHNKDSLNGEEHLRLVPSAWVDFEHARREFEALESAEQKLALLPKMITCLEATLQSMPGDADVEYLLVQCRDALRTLRRTAADERLAGNLRAVWPNDDA